MPAPFIHLRTHTAYSLLEGAIRPKELVSLCKDHRMPAVAITDRNNLFGSLELSNMLAGEGIQPIIGCTLDFTPHQAEGSRQSPQMQQQPERLVLIAQTEAGYHHLLWLVSEIYLTLSDESPWLDYEVLNDHHEGIICLTGGVEGGLASLLASGRAEEAEHFLRRLQGWFGDRLYIELQRHGLPEEQQVEPALIKLALEHNIPLVATNEAYFPNRTLHEAHDALLCIAEGRYVTEEARRKVTPEHYFKDASEMRELFADIPEALENTVQIARRCAMLAPSRQPILPRFGDIEQEKKMLQAKAVSGLEERLQDHVLTLEMEEEKRQQLRAQYEERLQYELGIIGQMGFPGYFLIVADFIQWAKDHAIPVGPGRGSGAGSIVAWALRITDLDPIRFGLLFERFLNPERISMPDFDIDFCQDRRDEVIRYVQEKYGNDQVAQIITFGKLQARAALRDVGRVLQLSYGQVDRICKLVPNNPAQPVTLQEAIDGEPALREAIREDESVRKMTDVALKLEGLYRHASTHAAGVVIGDRPLVELLPLYRDAKSDMLVVQYSMKYAEMAGLVKFDFLGLKTLTVLETARQMVIENHGVTLDLLQLPEGDGPTYELLGKGDAIGVFQLESAGMRDTLRKLKPDTLEDIIALVSLYRPGPMDNIPTYIDRKHGKEKPEYLHPMLEPILEETFGVIIYQEQVMQIAQQLASYSLGEADLLRRAMGKKIASEMEAQRAIFTERAVKNGVPEATAKAIYDLIAKFASYGFNKSHAAAYALIAYQTAYLKANYPAEFLAASMTYDMHNTDKLAIFVAEARRMGIEVLPPDVNQSRATFAVESGAIRYALGALKNVGVDAMTSLVKEREAHGAFKDVFDLASRASSKVLNKRQCENLIRAGAFDRLSPNRQQLFMSLDVVLAYHQAQSREQESSQHNLFADVGGEAVVPQPKLKAIEDWKPTERLQEEFSATGFYLNEHPLKRYHEVLEKLGVTQAEKFESKLNADYRAITVAGIITSVKFKRSPKGRFAFVAMSDPSNAFEVSIFDETIIDNQRDILEAGSMVLIHAEGKYEESGARLITKRIKLLDQAMQQQSERKAEPIELAVSSKEALQAIQAQLPASDAQKGRVVRMHLPLQSPQARNVVVQLPGYYPINTMLEHELRDYIKV
jgi:DNA polymerase-3 subunit alpha